MMEILQLSLPALEEKIIQELESNIALELVEPDVEESLPEDCEASSQEDALILPKTLTRNFLTFLQDLHPKVMAEIQN